MIRLRSLLLLLLCTRTTMSVGASEEPLEVQFKPRSPEQIAAFYEARGFPRAMIELLKQQCFISVRIHNNSKEVVWLELANWHFHAGGKTVHRQHRDYWKQRWMKMQIPLASQSTFRWTLLPEELDFQPDEAEGGNIILPRQEEAIRLEAEFPTGQDKQGVPIRIRHEALHCARDVH